MGRANNKENSLFLWVIYNHALFTAVKFFGVGYDQLHNFTFRANFVFDSFMQRHCFVCQIVFR